MNDVDIKLVGDTELLAALKELDYKTQQKFLKRILNDTATKTFVKRLRIASPERTGNLKKSMGKVTGKSRRVATVFAGPRMGGSHKGHVANILEHAKTGRRFPKKGVAMKIGDKFVKSVGPITRKTNFKQVILNTVSEAEGHMSKSVRTIIERVIRKHAR